MPDTLSDMRYDENVFAVVTAYDLKNKASSALKLPHNSKWLRSAVGGVAETPTIDSREATPAASGDTPSEDDEPHAADRLIVTFDKLLLDCPSGLQFGTRPTSSHILLGHRGTRGISARQYNIVVDEELRIWLHDYTSTHGTAVAHDGQNEEETRKKEKWILAFGPGMETSFHKITVYSSGLAIRIEFPNHESARSQYIKNLKRFFDRQNAHAFDRSDIPTLRELEVDSASTTQAPSEAQTPSQRLVYYKDKLIGTGAYGMVHTAIRTRDATVVAAKTFTRPANKRGLDEADPRWLMGIRREFAIMRDNPHAILDFHETPEPMIVMAYYPRGNIADAGLMDDELYVSALGQILDGLSHLHAQGTVHRDLKPENILVETQPLFKVVIADFGLAKVIDTATLLTTFCGTLKYAAPEVFPGISDGHGPTADIWSLGVIGLEWLYDIPAAPRLPKVKDKQGDALDRSWNRWIKLWSAKLIAKVRDEDDDLVIQILSHMLAYEASDRWSAKRCLEQGFTNGLFRRREADDLVICDDESADPSSDGSGRFRRSQALSPKQGPVEVTVTPVPAGS
ncbi:hypothetical protein HIM_05467 [Hirsutella minnesotensis 3608]|uniref:Protein kinase domain-containing protein n=1 Tax=Hirsutella minnesotensis 3608 TaxID=1043627 RepID=A0A0F7ZUQ5_9HYPO|nr:hypothetical protein HIM_05467 [Hirsutella minnesotensis 3608]